MKRNTKKSKEKHVIHNYASLEQTSSWTGSTPTSQMEIVNFKPSMIDCNTKFKTERFIKYKIVITVGCYLERKVLKV